LGTHTESSVARAPVFRHACGLCSLRDWCWPPGAEAGDLDRLHSIVQQTGPLPTGSHLFRSDDPFTAIYAVRSGCIKTYATDLSGHEHVHDFHLPGELLGFDAVYPKRHLFNALILKRPGVHCFLSGYSGAVPAGSGTAVADTRADESGFLAAAGLC